MHPPSIHDREPGNRPAEEAGKPHHDPTDFLPGLQQLWPDARAPERVVITGCGDVGMRLGMLLRALGSDVTGTAVTQEGLRRIRAAGLRAHGCDLDTGEGLGALDLRDTALCHCAPPPATGTCDPRLALLLARASRGAAPRQLLLLSTSGVYGDRGGAVVGEDDALRPKTDRARRRVDAERQAAAFSHDTDVPLTVFRVPGIYGPGRLPVDAVRTGLPVLHPAEPAATNRIHADDLARLCAAALIAGSAGVTAGVFNVSDGVPGHPSDIPLLLAELLGLAVPPLIPWHEAERTFSTGRLSFLRESRLLDISRLRRELPVPPLYPTLRDGVLQALRHDGVLPAADFPGDRH